MSESAQPKVVLITGMSGSGKSVAIRALEDNHFYCIDNLPPPFIPQVLNRLNLDGRNKVAIAVDARTGRDITSLPDILRELKKKPIEQRVVFLDADDDTLVTRYSETRRRHPMSERLGEDATVLECVQAERTALDDLRPLADCIDTSGLMPNVLRNWVLQTVGAAPSGLTVIFQSFGFKKGLPRDADLVFDVRCLDNPHYDKDLRPLTGRHPDIQAFIQKDERSGRLIDDIENYLRNWLPNYRTEQRSYVTVAVGCTGGQHRSVYVAENLARIFRTSPLAEIESILLRHRHMIEPSQ